MNDKINNNVVVVFTQEQISQINELVYQIQSASFDGLMGMIPTRAEALRKVGDSVRILSDKINEGELTHE